MKQKLSKMLIRHLMNSLKPLGDILKNINQN